MHAERIPSVNSQLPTSKSQPLSNSNSQLPIKSELGSSRVEPTRAAWCLTDLAVRTVAVIAVVIVCLAGCRFESTNPQLPPRPLERNTHTLSLPRNRRHQPSDRTKLLGQLEAANAHWNREGPMTYELTVSLRCFCDPGVPFVSRVTGVTLVRSTGGYRRDGRSGGLPCARSSYCFPKRDERFTATQTKWRWNSIRDSGIRRASGSTTGVIARTTNWNGSRRFRCCDSLEIDRLGEVRRSPRAAKRDRMVHPRTTGQGHPSMHNRATASF